MSNVEHCFLLHRSAYRLAKILFEEVIRDFLEAVTANRRDSDLMFDHQLGQSLTVDEYDALAFDLFNRVDHVARVVGAMIKTTLLSV